MEGLLVSEVAERTGVPASTVRYYDRHGVISPPGRDSNGYRRYPEVVVDQIDRIRQAKALGLTLDEVGALLRQQRDGTRCVSVHQHLASSISRSRAVVGKEQARLSALDRRIAAAATRLADAAVASDPCRADCACDAALSGGEPPVPDGCTLDREALDERLARWQEITTKAISAHEADDAVHLTFTGDPDVAARLAHLAAAETDCCSTTRVRIDVAPSGLSVTIRASTALPGFLLRAAHRAQGTAGQDTSSTPPGFSITPGPEASEAPTR